MQLPSQKAWGAGLGGIIGWGVGVGLNQFFQIDIGEGGIGAIATLMAIIFAHFVPPADQDVLAHVNDTIAQAGTIIGKLTPASDSLVPPSIDARVLAGRVSPGVK